VRRSRGAAVALAATAWLVAGCGATQFQTARTVPRGSIMGFAGISFVGNELFADRGVTVYNFQPDFGCRVGVLDGMDVGISHFFVLGLLGDVKVNLVPPDWDFALSVKGGFGAAADVGEIGDAWLLHIPVTLMASYRIGRVEPYVGLGYGFFWIFGRRPPEGSVERPPERKGYGDGVVRATAGVEIMLTARVGLLFEYTYMPAVVDDPGDYYSFVDNHIGSVGVRF
jgi:hypothetical protein